MRPSRVLRVYLGIAFAIGVLLSIPMVLLIRDGELSSYSAIVLTACWNVLFLMLLPLVLDWSEHKYFKARFVQLEELAQTNPELKAVLDEQCEKLSLPGLRLAAVDTPVSETFTYGLWRQNPRLVVPSSWLSKGVDKEKLIPSIEVELARFARRDVSFVFLAFIAVQCAFQQLLLLLHV